MNRKIILMTLVSIILFPFFEVHADTSFAPYNSYIYNAASGDAVYVPNAYMPYDNITGQTIGTTAFSAPEDMTVDENGSVYILDTGNNRIVVLNKDFTLKKTIDVFKYKEENLYLDKATGLYVANGVIYICDTGNQRVIVSDVDGNVKLITEKPTSLEFSQSLAFEPKKITADKSGNFYVLCNNVYQGAVVFTPSGDFDGYFGSTKVQSTFQILSQLAFKKFMTKEQRSKLPKYIPAEFENLSVRNDFIYTVAYETNSDSVNSMTAIRKLNPSGVNIADNTSAFGDTDVYYDKTLKESVYTKFCDLYVDEDEYIYALDSTYGKIFVYDNLCNLLFVLGNKGEQIGTFQYPVAIEKSGKYLLVLDRGKGSLTLFSPTDFFYTVKEANRLFNNGLYDEALQPWNKVLSECNNYSVAYTGIGKALFNKGEYESAMEYFKKSSNQSGYSDAYKYYRLNFIQNHFTAIVFTLVALIALCVLYKKLLSKRVKVFVGAMTGRIPEEKRIRGKTPFICMRHPFEGFENMRDTNTASYLVSSIIVLFWVLSELFKAQFTGFSFNEYVGKNINMTMMLIQTLGLYVLWVISSIAFRTFLAGRGRLVDVCATSSYIALPVIFANVIQIVLSQFLILEEAAFLNWISIIGVLWSAIMLIGGVKGINEYELKKSVGAILLNALGVVLIVFLFILFYSSLQQVISLIATIYSELQYRFF